MMSGAPVMSGGDAVIRSLLAHDISTIYCLPGVQSDHLFNAMFDAGDALTVVHTRHEQGAAYMALGAALATGKPAAYSVVPGPGFLNSTAALATAYSTGARIVALIGQLPSHAIGKGHGLLHEIPDQLGILRKLTKWADRAEKPQDAPGIIARAFKELGSGRARPVGVEVPPDMLQARAAVELIAPLPLDAVPALDDAAIERAADLLAKAECPVIFVGGGALDAATQVRALAERLGAPVVAYRRGKGVLDDRHPLSHMLPGGHALWRSADVVLAVGTRLQMQLSGWGTDDKLKLIKVDIDPEELDRIRTPEIGLAGDAAAVLARINAHLRHLPPTRPERVAQSRALKERIAAEATAALAPQAAFLRAIRDALPDDGVLIDELTQVGYSARHLRGAQAAHLHLVGLPGHARLGRRRRARRQARARRAAGGRAQRRRRLHVQRAGALDRGAPPHPDRHDHLQRWRLRQRAQHAKEPARQPLDRHRSRQSRFRTARRKLRHRRPSRRQSGGPAAGAGEEPRQQRAGADRGAGGRDAEPVAVPRSAEGSRRSATHVIR
jgi:acetolactate synthase I/II/III large subunit